MNTEELFERIKKLAYYSYFYSGVYAMLKTMTQSEKDAWLGRMCKKLSRVSPKNINSKLGEYFMKECKAEFRAEYVAID